MVHPPLTSITCHRCHQSTRTDLSVNDDVENGNDNRASNSYALYFTSTAPVCATNENQSTVLSAIFISPSSSHYHNLGNRSSAFALYVRCFKLCITYLSYVP